MPLPQTPLLSDAMRLLNKSVVSPDDLRQAQRLILDYLDRPRREAEWRDDPRLPMAPSRR